MYIIMYDLSQNRRHLISYNSNQIKISKMPEVRLHACMYSVSHFNCFT